ncbi:MAG: MDR family MFS transporter [Chloroflexota bacterium]|nr:MFS transporter [Chloroflexota bacterium]MBI5703198.1 MFS transporter [Chloroflexota bacterium]
MLTRIKHIYHEFPRLFWVVVVVSFIDRIGGTLLFPFFALYITQKFNVGMTQAGILLGMSSLFGLLGSTVGGALTDKFGRKRLILFGLVFSAISALTFGLVNDLNALYPIMIVVGLLSSVAHPAHDAMIADILPEHQRQEGFGILRVVSNLSWMIGPTIGGIVANINFFYLFVIDAVISCLVAALIFRAIPETKPEPHAHAASESLWQTVSGYRIVLRDAAFMAFMVAGMLMLIVYQQMYSTLSVYLRDNHGTSPSGYGFLMTTSAITVVLFQFWVSRLIKRRPPFLMMAFGTLFYLIGFTLFGIVTAYILFVLNIVIITIGEMILVPTSQAIATNFAPQAMRGRYMAIFGLSWAIPSTIGPAAAGYILDNFNPNLLWFLGGLLCGLSALAYYALHLRFKSRPEFTPPKEAISSLPNLTLPE